MSRSFFLKSFIVDCNRVCVFVKFSIYEAYRKFVKLYSKPVK